MAALVVFLPEKDYLSCIEGYPGIRPEGETETGIIKFSRISQ